MKRLGFIIWLCILAVLSVMAVIPNLMVMPDGADKILHITGLCFLMLWPTLVLVRRRSIFALAFVLLCAGIAVEYIQGFSPGRQSSLEDVLANAVGIMVGLAIGFLMRRDFSSTRNSIS